MPITPNADQFAELVADSDTNTGEVVMLNLLKYKARATDGEGGSGEASYGRYAAQAIQMVEAQGGRVLWIGRPDQVLIGDATDGRLGRGRAASATPAGSTSSTWFRSRSTRTRTAP